VVVDDVTRVDARTRDLLMALVRRPVRSTLIVLAARSDELAPSPIADEVGRTSDARRVRLPPLSAPEVDALIGSMLELGLAERRTVAARLHAESGGNP